MRAAAVAVGALLASCATPPPTVTAAGVSAAGLVPATIGAMVRAAPAGITITSVGQAGEAAGLRPGDIVLRYNGAEVTNERQFYRLVLGSAPGSVARLELRREDRVERIEVPVRPIDTSSRG